MEIKSGELITTLANESDVHGPNGDHVGRVHGGHHDDDGPLLKNSLQPHHVHGCVHLAKINNHD